MGLLRLSVHQYNVLSGGMELASLCDVIVTSEEYKFGQPEINFGLIPE